MSTKKLIVEVEVQNAANTQQQMDKILESLKKVTEQQGQLLKTTQESANAILASHEKIGQAEAERGKSSASLAQQQNNLAKAQNQVASSAKSSNNAQQQNTRSNLAASRAARQFGSSVQRLVSSGTQLLRMYALWTAASEEDAKVMLQRIAYFESMVQGVQGLTGAYFALNDAMAQYQRLQRLEQAGFALSGLERLALGGGKMLSRVAVPAAVAAVGFEANRRVYGHARETGQGSVFGNVGVGEGGIPTGIRGITDEGILADPRQSYMRQFLNFLGGELQRPLGGGFENTPMGTDARFQFGPGLSRRDREIEMRRREELERQMRQRSVETQRRTRQYSLFGSFADTYGTMAGADFIAPEMRSRLLESQRERLQQKSDIFIGTDRRAMSAEPGYELLQDQWNTVQKLAADTARVTQEKLNKELEGKRNLIDKERDLYSATLERLAKLQEAHNLERSAQERYLAMTPEERAQANAAGRRILRGAASEEDYRITSGLFSYEAGREARTMAGINLAGQTGFYESPFAAPDASLQKTLEAFKEIGKLRLELDTSGEQIIKLEGEWESLAQSMGEKVATKVEEKWGDLMETVIGEIEMLQQKIESDDVR